MPAACGCSRTVRPKRRLFWSHWPGECTDPFAPSSLLPKSDDGPPKSAPHSLNTELVSTHHAIKRRQQVPNQGLSEGRRPKFNAILKHGVIAYCRRTQRRIATFTLATRPGQRKHCSLGVIYQRNRQYPLLFRELSTRPEHFRRRKISQSLVKSSWFVEKLRSPSQGLPAQSLQQLEVKSDRVGTINGVNCTISQQS